MALGVSHQIESELRTKGRRPTQRLFADSGEIMAVQPQLCVGLRPFEFVLHAAAWLTPWAGAVPASGLKKLTCWRCVLVNSEL